MMSISILAASRPPCTVESSTRCRQSLLLPFAAVKDAPKWEAVSIRQLVQAHAERACTGDAASWMGCYQQDGGHTSIRSWISRPWKMLSSGKAPKSGSGCRYTLNRCWRCSTATLCGLLQYCCASCNRSVLQGVSASSTCAPCSP